ncbi:MAG: M56 family metallopeptidase [Mucilaginibacter sp.]|uniref:M56 family metallopeptidase n=1 Tax=Mucilaginibacter sp. TaxID=1882438 RepID=UPI0031A4B257
MQSLFYNISQVLGITLIHSLWQGLLVWFALRLLFTCVPSLSAVKKHNWSMTALLAITAWFIGTLIVQVQNHIWVNLSATASPDFLPYLDFPLKNAAHSVSTSYYNYVIEGYLPYLSAFYFAGLIFNILKMGLNWQKISLIKRTMIPARQVQTYVDDFCQKLHINKYVSVNFSRFIDVPCMIGFFKPIILLPVTLTTYLSVTEVESILLHELSHIKRNDYLLNMVQQFATIMLFFNPFAQLINRIINQERENRCDDLVIQTTAQPLIYAQALLKLEQSRQVNLPLALAATGKKHHLLNRIERIMKPQKTIGNIRHLLVAIAIITASISSVAWLNPTIKEGKLSIKKVTYPKAVVNLFTDTLKLKKDTAKRKQGIATKKTAKNKSIQQKFKYSDEFNGLNDAELNRLTAEVSKHADAIGKYYNSPEFKAQSDLIAQKGKAISDYYNSPAMQQLQESQKKMADEFAKDWGDNSQTQKINDQMNELGEKISTYFSSSEFKQIDGQLRKKYGIPADQQYFDDKKDENYRKYQAELHGKVSPKVMEEADQLKKLGGQIRSRYSSPEFNKKRDQLKAMSDSIKRVYANQDMKIQRDEMKKISEQMRNYQNNPQMKQEQELLKQASKNLRDYTQSPAFKKKMEEYRKQTESAFDFKYDLKMDPDVKKDTLQ